MQERYLSETEVQLELAGLCRREKAYARAHQHMKLATISFAKAVAYMFRPSLHQQISADNLYSSVRHLMKYYKDAINIIVAKQAGSKEHCEKLERVLDREVWIDKDALAASNLEPVRFFERSVAKLPVEIPCGDITRFLNRSVIPFGVYLEHVDFLIGGDLHALLNNADADETSVSLHEIRRSIISIAAKIAAVFSTLYACTVLSLNDGELIGRRGYGLSGYSLSCFGPIRSYPIDPVRIQNNYLGHLTNALRLLTGLSGNNERPFL